MLITAAAEAIATYCRRMDELECELDTKLMDLAISRREQLLEKIIATPANDIEGLRAKVRVWLAYSEGKRRVSTTLARQRFVR